MKRYNYNFFLERIILFIYKKIILYHDFFKNLFYSTYSYKKKKINSKILNYLKKDDFSNIQVIKKKNINEYLLHNFNLLGSNKSNLDLKKKMKINFRNKIVSEKIRKNLDYHYKPLDWQRDFKSNYRWDEKKLSKKIKFLNIPKTDIKIPWEFTRMQHLPQLALYAKSIKNKKFIEALKIFNEFKNQIVDFVGSNPPGYGINWISAMEVAIRISNILVARDIFKSCNFILSEKIEDIFNSTINDHLGFILKNLEYSSYRGNHYLSNICGLAVISRYLENSIFSDNLIAFVSQELNKEIFYQFNEDGGNKEGSTSYHKFTMEMIFYATAIILSHGKSRLKMAKKKLNPNILKSNFYSPKLKIKNYRLYKINKKYFKCNFLSPFPKKYFLQMLKILNFFESTIQTNNQILQIGDNDSGVFFNFKPEYYLNINSQIDKKNYENRESANYILNISEGWGIKINDKNLNKKQNFEKIFLNLLLGKIQFKKNILNIFKTKNKKININSKIKFYNLKNKLKLKENLYEQKYSFSINKNYLKNLEYKKFSKFGLHVWKNKNIYFTFRSVTTYNKKFSTHFHYDQISNTLMINNKSLIIDPGTFCYNRNTELRNKFRGYIEHFSPIFILHNKNSDIFGKINSPKSQDLLSNKSGYLARVSFGNELYYSASYIDNNKINIYHLSNKKLYTCKIKKKIFSPGYGILMKS